MCLLCTNATEYAIILEASISKTTLTVPLHPLCILNFISKHSEISQYCVGKVDTHTSDRERHIESMAIFSLELGIILANTR